MQPGSSGEKHQTDKKRLEQSKKRLSDLDVIMSKLYEDYGLGNLSADRYKKMFADYDRPNEEVC